MADKKGHKDEPPKSDLGVREDSCKTEMDRRVTALEKAVVDVNTRVFDSHKWFVTILFSAVAVLLTVFGVISRLDVKDSTATMERRLETRASEMEKKIQAAVGEALKKPSLSLLTATGPLENQTLELTTGYRSSPNEAAITSLFVHNGGDKRTEPLSISVWIAGSVTLLQQPSDWEAAVSVDKEFGSSFYSMRHITVAPDETVNIHALPLDWVHIAPWNNPTNPPAIPCKIQVFYGGERPAEARFKIRVKLP